MESAANALSGSVAGLISMAILYPFDNVRTRLQVQRKPQQQQQEQQRRGRADSHVSLYNGALDCARQVVAKEGMGGLYSGIASGLVGILVSSGTYFFWYDMFKRLVLMWEGRLSQFKKQNIAPWQNSVVAFAAGSLNVITTLPLWLLNTRMKLGKYTSIAAAAQDVFAKDGIRGFYGGLVPSLILVINPVVQFVSYDAITRLLFKWRFRSGISSSSSSSSSRVDAHLFPAAKHPWIDDAAEVPPDNINHMPSHKSPVSSSSSLSSMEYFFCAALAKALATVLTYPYQVVKERLQAKAYQGHYKGTWHAVQTMYEEEGISVFFRGLSAKIVQSVLNAAFLLMFYEKFFQKMVKLLRWINAARTKAVL